MSLQRAEIFNFKFTSEKQLQKFIIKLIEKKVQINFLDRSELGKSWAELKNYKAKNKSKSRESQIENINKAIEKHKPKGLLSGFLENKVQVNISNLEDLEGEEDIMNSVKDYLIYVENINLIKQLKTIESKKKTIGFVVESEETDIQYELDSYYQKLNDSIKSKNSEIGNFDKPKFEVTKFKNFSLVTTNIQNQDNLKLLISKIYSEDKIFLLKNFLEKITEDNNNINSKLNLNRGLVPNATLKSWKILKAKLELPRLYDLALSKAYVTEKARSLYVYAGIDPQNTETIKDITESLNVYFDTVNWSEEVYDWESSENMQPFQDLLKPIGGLRKGQLDPSFLVSISFVLFFALCLGDAIYGLIISLSTLLLLKHKNLKDNFKPTLRLFLYSGIVTTIYGILTNSWAGDAFSYLKINGSGIDSSLQNLQIINYLDPKANVIVNNFLRNNGEINPIVFALAGAIFIGIIHIFLGYLLKLINSISLKEYADFRNTLTWVLFLLSLLALPLVLGLYSEFTTISLSILGLTTLGIMVFNEGKGLGGKVMSILLDKLLGLIGFFSESMSYSRLIAVGLTSGIIANVVNLLAELLYNAGVDSLDGNWGKILGILLAISMLIIGHVFNFIIAVFGAYINPLRLHYVEFLPKFYDGGGRLLETDLKPLNEVEIVS